MSNGVDMFNCLYSKDYFCLFVEAMIAFFFMCISTAVCFLLVLAYGPNSFFDLNLHVPALLIQFVVLIGFISGALSSIICLLFALHRFIGMAFKWIHE